jgi:hypothetical protein
MILWRKTYHSLDDVRKVVASRNQQRALLGIVGANLVDPAQDEGPSAKLNDMHEQDWDYY